MKPLLDNTIFAEEKIMPRRPRPPVTKRSEHWLRVMVNEHTGELNKQIAQAFKWKDVQLEWMSPVKDDGYAEYYDQTFLDRLNVKGLTMPLEEFWPKSGPRWDALARTKDGKLLLVEAKAHIEECIDYHSKASENSLLRIEKRINEAKEAFRASKDACWLTPFYQTANRLAHLYYLAEINRKDTYLVFIHFANAPDVANPVSHEAWLGAIRQTRKILGLKDSRLTRRMADIIVCVDTICGQ